MSTNIAVSQQLAVRSGEHDKFTRLVIYTQSPGAWNFGRVEQGYELRLSLPESTFDLSRAFALIPKTRIGGLEDLGRGRLLINTDCDCHADVFAASGGQIVVDIISGKVIGGGEGYDAFLDKPGVQRDEGSSLAGGTQSRDLGTTNARLGLPLLTELTSQDSDIPPTAPDGSHENKVLSTLEKSNVPNDREQATESIVNLQMNPEQRERVQETELALIEQIGRAAAQGLIDANLSTLEAEVDRVTHPIAETQTSLQDLEPEFEPIENLDANAHVAVQTSIDRETALQASERQSTQEGLACLPNQFYDIEMWGGEVKSGIDLAKHKSGFLGEFDQPNSEVITARARQLVYFTFGAEAKALTGRYATLIEGADSLLQMAEIMDDLKASHANKHSPQMGCDGKTALWAALAQPEFRPGQEINKRAIISSFSELPLHLRRHLGPSLAKKFLDSGDKKTAVSLRNILGRAAGDHGPEFQFLEAQIELENGNTQMAEARLTDIVNEDTGLSAKAALEIVNSRLSQNQAVPPRIIELVSTFAFEQQDAPLGVDLKTAEIRARANNADFDAAYIEIERGVADQQLQAKDARALTQIVLNELVIRGSDSEFLRYTIGSGLDYETMDVKLRKSIAQRLVDIGMASSARALLDVAGSVPDEDQRLVFAKIALAEEKPDVALGYLVGFTSNSAERLRAEALSMAGDHSSSAEIYKRLSDDDAQHQAAWRAGEWSQLVDGEDGSIPAISHLMLARELENPNNDGVLAFNSTLLSKSEETRNIIRGLLKEFPNP